MTSTMHTKSRWLRHGAVAIAAIGSFSTAAWLRPPMNDTEIVLPTERKAAIDRKLARVEDSAPQGNVAPFVIETRTPLESHVFSNPFGPMDVTPTPAESEVAAIGAPKGAVAMAKQVLPAATPQALMGPPAPTVPPLPFEVVGTIAGKVIADGRLTVFLRQRDDVLVVHAGDEIAKTYRVDAVGPEAVEFTYLPLNQKQSLSIRP
jgi:hypothetical protein